MLERGRVQGIIESKKGFYIGDLCYGASDDTYQVYDQNGFDDGIYEDPKTGLKFAVASTAYGDGEFEDEHGNKYGVDAGNLSIIPYEIADQSNRSLGSMHYFEGEGKASFVFEDGEFSIILPKGTCVNIDTNFNEWDEDDWKEDDWEEDDYLDDEDEEVDDELLYRD